VLVDFLRWGLKEGQDKMQRLYYVRLPEELARRSDQMIDRIQVAK